MRTWNEQNLTKNINSTIWKPSISFSRTSEGIRLWEKRQSRGSHRWKSEFYLKSDPNSRIHWIRLWFFLCTIKYFIFVSMMNAIASESIRENRNNMSWNRKWFIRDLCVCTMWMALVGWWFQKPHHLLLLLFVFLKPFLRMTHIARPQII